MRLAVFGFGKVGATLAAQAVRIGASVCALGEPSAVLLPRTQSFSLEEISALSEEKKKGLDFKDAGHLGEVLSLSEYLDQLQQENLILADCSAADDAYKYLLPCHSRGIPIALANKKPLSSSLDLFQTLTSDLNKINYEATVGAGLPVIKPLQRLIASGDQVWNIQGCLSGTLGFISSNIESGTQYFSSVVREAKAKGFTEPDPRDDLSGVDVARKTLILARTLGKEIELSDISIEALFPSSFASYSVEEFMERLDELDVEFAQKVEGAKSRDCKLRYVAEVQVKDKVSLRVGLQEVGATSALGSLEGTDNCVVFESKSYSTNKLVVRGPGAGLEVTAEGVLADCLDLYHKNY